MMATLKCGNCGNEMKGPMCCGQPMHMEGDKFFCHKGAECGCGNDMGKSIPEHCGQPMNLV
ncbi:hypothetical protein LCGC14_0831240 [marine sediment metagenome]|uniref:Uncharacterized protein n=1 Tax=marine sediment metagenome TaxID=412755 RepID=A0A0F9PFV5_9ZZZZ|nr:hypothetical protein [archaeon]